MPINAGDAAHRRHLEETLKPLYISDCDHDKLMDRATEMEDWDHIEEIAVGSDSDEEGYDEAESSKDDEEEEDKEGSQEDKDSK